MSAELVEAPSSALGAELVEAPSSCPSTGSGLISSDSGRTSLGAADLRVLLRGVLRGGVPSVIGAGPSAQSATGPPTAAAPDLEPPRSHRGRSAYGAPCPAA